MYAQLTVKVVNTLYRRQQERDEVRPLRENNDEITDANL
jgi:hypothetical protein